MGQGDTDRRRRDRDGGNARSRFAAQCQKLIELLRNNRPNDTVAKLVLNQIGQPKRPEIPVKDFAETIGVEPVAVLAFDAACSA